MKPGGEGCGWVQLLGSTAAASGACVVCDKIIKLHSISIQDSSTGDVLRIQQDAPQGRVSCRTEFRSYGFPGGRSSGG